MNLKAKSALLPLVILWLAAHGLVLALILGVKFLGAKTILVLGLISAGAWFIVKRRPARLLAPRSVV